jgi:apolipoprotein D and lipocalin family protein
MAKVLITGGTGLIGQHLSRKLLKNGYDVVVLSRHRSKNNDAEIPVYYWDIDKNEIDQEALNSCDYIIHLAGVNIGEKRWTDQRYEIARYNHRFERGLVGVTANYSIREDGKIKVLNSGYKKSLDGKFSQATGKAFLPDPELEPGKLKVSFFWNFYGDYFVLDLDENYQWAIVGSSSDKYLWILSRTPLLELDIYNKLTDKIKSRGYDISQLIKVEQKSF